MGCSGVDTLSFWLEDRTWRLLPVFLGWGRSACRLNPLSPRPAPSASVGPLPTAGAQAAPSPISKTDPSKTSPLPPLATALCQRRAMLTGQPGSAKPCAAPGRVQSNRKCSWPEGRPQGLDGFNSSRSGLCTERTGEGRRHRPLQECHEKSFLGEEAWVPAITLHPGPHTRSGQVERPGPMVRSLLSFDPTLSQ